MTNNEIDKLISMLDRKKLDELKKYLLKEKELNISKLRQKAFEKYLTTNILGYNDKSLPKLYSEKNIQIFSNYISIYIINKNFLKTDTPFFSRAANYSRNLLHQFELVTEDEINLLLKQMEMRIGQYKFDILSIENNATFQSHTYEVEYYNELYDKKQRVSFSKKEIDTADILLNNPKYTYCQNYLIEAKSEIGKAYILGHKINPNK